MRSSKTIITALIESDTLTQILSNFQLTELDLATSYILDILELSVLTHIDKELDSAQQNKFLGLYQAQLDPQKLWDYLDSIPNTGKLALKEIVKRQLFVIQTNLTK